MSEMSEDVSRRALLSLLGLGSALLLGSTVVGVSDAEAQTPGMERREERRTGRQERRQKRRGE